ncbi:MAG: RNA polymerase sigma factor [Polyangiaceae bacterium]
MSSSITRAAVEAIWRIEAPRLIGGLVRFTRDVDLAEDLAQEALVAALERWPDTGVPDNPGAWLTTTAKHRAVDVARRNRMMHAKHAELARELEEDVESNSGSGAEDDVLRLVLTACHPVVPREGRVALTLRLLGGLTTDEIARAFLVSEPTVAQRIVRAKRTLMEARVPFEVPTGDALRARLPSVFEVLYLVFNEGYAAAAGDDWMRPELCQDAMRMARVLAALVPDEAEAHGLVALMELQASRMRARTDAAGQPILLLDQNRARWDHALIQHGLAALRRAEALARPLGVYTLQAAIAGCHARAHTASETDWPRIVALYDALAALTGSPIVELNRAVALGFAVGPQAALELVDELVESGALEGYHLLSATRGDLLEKLGRVAEARLEFARAASLASNQREKAVLLARERKLQNG